MRLQKTRKMQPDFLFIMHLRRLIIEDVNVLSELTDWILLTGKKISAAVAGGCDAIRIPKTESAQDVKVVEAEVVQAEKDFGREEGSVLIMAAIESARGVMRALDICESSERLFGIALSCGDYTKDLQTHITGTGIELMGARQNG